MLKKIHFFFIPYIVVLIAGFKSSSEWGFFGHKLINRTAVFTLPPPLISFYKANLTYIVEKSVNPDMRRYVIKDEGPKHYLDVDSYPDTLFTNGLPKYYLMDSLFSTEFLHENGTLPWNLIMLKSKLTMAFSNHNHESILRYSTDAAHYLSDANVPLHTTSNYNGQETDQHGIHGFWESRLPELFSEQYFLATGKAEYIVNFKDKIWATIQESKMAVDSVLLFEKELNDNTRTDKKYSYEMRGKNTVRTYSRSYSRNYHRQLNGMVERRLKSSIKLVGDFWYTCWVDAGMPNLSDTVQLKLKYDNKIVDSVNNSFDGRGH